MSAVSSVPAAFERQPPPPVRRIVLGVALVGGVAGWLLALPWWVCVVCLAYVVAAIVVSVLMPDSVFAVQADDRDREEAERFNIFVSALAAGGVIDDDTMPDEISISTPAPLVYEVEIHKPGVTWESLARACAASVDVFACVDVDVVRTAPSVYRVTYSSETPIERCARHVVRYRDLPRATSATSLPIGAFEDGSPVCVNLESRNVLIGGNPRSGKSMALAALLCGLCRLPHERVYVLSPKSLDFAVFASKAQVIQEPAQMLACLQEVREEAERRKAWCEDRGLKKIEPRHYAQVPHITVVVDEFAAIRARVVPDEKGKMIKIGEQIQQAVFGLVAECGFAGISFVLSTQKASGATGISTDLRDLISGARVCFATETVEATRMVLGEAAALAPCHEITPQQRGVGYVSVDGGRPRAFRGALVEPADEEESVKR